VLFTKKPILRGRRLAFALALGFVLVCLIQVASLALLLVIQDWQEQIWTRLQAQLAPAMSAQENMENSFSEVRSAWRSYLLTGDPEMKKNFDQAYERLTMQLSSTRRTMEEIGPGTAAAMDELQAAIMEFHREILFLSLKQPVPMSAADFQQYSEASAARATPVNHAFFRLKEQLQRVDTQLSNEIDYWMNVKLVGISSLVAVALIITGYIGWLSLRAVRFFRQAEEERRAAVRQGQFFKAALDQLPAGVSVRSAPSGDTVMVNRAARQFMGRARIPQSITQVTTEGVLHPDGTPYRTTELPTMRALTRGETVSSEEMLLEHASGGRTAVLCSSTPITDERHQTIAAVTIFQDITDRKTLESSLRAKTLELNRLVKEQQRQIESLKQLQEITAKVSAQTSVRDICHEVLPAIAAMLNVEKCYVRLADPEMRELKVAAPAYGLPDEQVATIPTLAVSTDGSPIMRAFWEDAAVVFNDVVNDTAAARYRPVFFQLGIHAMVNVRLAARGRPIGILAVFDRRDSQPFTSQDVQLLRILASPLGIAFDNARLYESLRERNEQLTTLLQEAHHRIKNNLAMVTSLLSLELSCGLDKSAAQLCASTISRIESIARVHALLTRDSTHGVPLRPLIEQLVQSLTISCLSPQQNISVDYEIAPLHLPSREATALALVTSELLSNALRHGFAGRDKGHLHVELRHEQAGEAVLEVVNDGEAVVPSATPTQHRLGLRIVETLSRRDLNGSFTVTSKSGRTTAMVRFQLPQDAGELKAIVASA
jgi:PAS domain S-box-containing protein